MADEYKIVDVWVGRFRDHAAFLAFFHETYGDDDTPLSPFAQSQGEHFYDHDFLETAFDELSTNLAARVAGHSFGGSFSTAAQSSYENLNRPAFNGLVLMWNREIEHPRSASTDSVELTYIGRFPCQPAH